MYCHVLLRSDTYALQVQWGKTYLLRVVNAAVNDELFFSIAGHTMTVVEIDATYTKPLAASTIQLSPGQTTNVLVRADQKPGRYFMAAKPFNHVPVPADDKTRPPPSSSTPASRPPSSPPRAVDRHLLYTIGLNIDPCRARSCLNGSRLAASLNNITFVMPAVALLQAHYGGLKGVFAADFPDRAPAGAVQLHGRAAHDGARHVAGHEAEQGRVQPAVRGVAPVPPPRLQLLRRREGPRQLRPGQGPRQVQPRRPAREEHRRRARRRLDRHPVQGRQSRCLVPALSSGGAHD